MPKIQKIKRKDLNLEKYAAAINSAVNYRIYAEYWFLDILTDEKWECLIYDDYKAVMPIPYQTKIGFKFVIQPTFCQQLGVFYKEEISEEVFFKFQELLKKYRVRSYHFNEENTLKFKPEGESRVNHLLNLNKSYDGIRKSYKKGRKSDLSLARRIGIQISEIKEVEELTKLYYAEFDFAARLISRDKTNRLLRTLMEKEKVQILKAINPSNEKDCAYRVLIDSGQRQILLLAVRNREFTNSGKDTILLDTIINHFSDTDKILDFEGSGISGIADFNKSFGAEKNFYTCYSNFNI